jgi:transketolase
MDKISRKIRQDIIDISYRSGHGHIPTCFSIIELIRAVYETMRHDPKRPDWEQRDIFILSKGHAALGLYCTLAYYGYFPISDVFAFGSYDAQFGCHADRLRSRVSRPQPGPWGWHRDRGGHGARIQTVRFVKESITLIGDGEANEGTVWEAVMVAANLRLDNLTILFDNNLSQVRCMPIVNPEQKFSSFGLNVTTVDGHDLEAIKQAMRDRVAGSPKVIVANTVKGMGCPTLVKEVFSWHRRSPDAQEFEILSGELNATSI